MIMAKKEEYIADYGEWHFESYWNEYTESWSVYQSEKTDEGFRLVTHMFRHEPIKTTEEAKEMVENWLEFQRRIRCEEQQECDD
jgi:hypothetical protein